MYKSNDKEVLFSNAYPSIYEYAKEHGDFTLEDIDWNLSEEYALIRDLISYADQPFKTFYAVHDLINYVSEAPVFSVLFLQRIKPYLETSEAIDHASWVAFAEMINSYIDDEFNKNDTEMIQGMLGAALLSQYAGRKITVMKHNA